jgi:5-methyltetrahydropteroyltriglutamate--homocysteine methyltransferase
MARSSIVGYPRIGKHRELKKATEGYWAGRVDGAELAAIGASIRRTNWRTQKEKGIDIVPSNDFSNYDQVLDTIALVGAVPDRYRWTGGMVDLDTYFAMARGAQRDGLDVPAMEMTKWFDTNYHYLVPEFHPHQHFALSSTTPVEEFKEARALGLTTKPVLLGPVSFLRLGKSRVADFDPLGLLDELLPVYGEIIAGLAAQGAEWIQLDEPCFVQDRTDLEREALKHAYDALTSYRGAANLIVQTYFGPAGESYRVLAELPVQGLGLDFVAGTENLTTVTAQGFPEDKILVAGLVDGRNIWATDLDAGLDITRRLLDVVSSDRLIVSSSCSLMHVPYDIHREHDLDTRLAEWLAFAEQKLEEVAKLTRAVNQGPEAVTVDLDARRSALLRRRRSEWVHRPEVKERIAEVSPEDADRELPYKPRRSLQREQLNLPLFPTTTIGSFPQTPEVRRNRSRLEKGEITEAEYDHFIAEEIRRAISLQEEIGIDVLVHGEFERNDMVQYFGERMEGFAFTRHGWVQSYGSRYTRPPIIFGDVLRPVPMTIRWSTFAQSLSNTPVKGMLTGPVTILNWSFVRDDQPREETCRQIALAIRDEVRDLQEAGLRIIQVDEPALREGLPLRHRDWQHYLDWAIFCFRLATGVADPKVQIHTHMCYSEFDDIIEAIAALDADVLSIENSRSNLELLETFRRFDYRQEIGPGVYDIHSQRVPTKEEMTHNLQVTSQVLRQEQLWVNPDCGLKTRSWLEVEPALRNMVQAARDLRAAAVAASREA